MPIRPASAQDDPPPVKAAVAPKVGQAIDISA
jgi:hypothetical protein